MSYLIFAWVATVAYGFSNILTKLTSKYAISNPWLFNWIFQLLVLVIIAPIALFNGAGIPVGWGNILLASFFFTAFYVFLTLAIFRLDISVVSPLFNLRTVVSVILGTLFLGEVIRPNQFYLIFVIVGAGLFVSLDERMKLSSFFKPSVALALAAMTSLAFNSVFIKKAIQETGYWQLTLWQYVFANLILLGTIPLFRHDIKKLRIKQIGAVFLVAVALVIGELTANRAYAQNVSVSATIISLPTAMILAFGLSVFAPKLLEKHSLKIYAIRFTAAAAMLIAALKLSL